MSAFIQHLFTLGESKKAASLHNTTASDNNRPYFPIAFTRNTTTAALACAEAIERPGLDSALIDRLLVAALTEHLAWRHSDTDQQGLARLAYNLLQPAKDSLQHFYQESKYQNPDFEDIIHSAHEECDLDFLQLVIGLYTQEFVRQTQTGQ